MARRIYISGPMTGKPDFNFPAFHAAAVCLQTHGWDVLNPAETFQGRTDLPREKYMRRDIELLLLSDAIAFLPEWSTSKGANLEYDIAEALGLEMYDAETARPFPVPTYLKDTNPKEFHARHTFTL